ncbi:MAG: helix-turn-helix domain-containing protein [Mycobacteriaceae bacterium]
MDQQQRMYEADALQAAMDRQGWSATDLVRESGVTKNTVTRALKGEPTQPSTLRKLREALGIQPLSVTYEEQGFDSDANTIGLAVKVWVQGLPPDERPTALAAMLSAIAGYRDTGQ